MHQLTTLLLFWVGVSAASLAAAVLVVAVEVCQEADDFAASTLTPACRATTGRTAFRT